MKKNLFAIFSLAVLVFVGAGCGKKNDDAPVTKTSLISRTWLLTGLTVSPAIFGQTNLLAGSSACELDDITVFTSAGTYTGEEGATKCSPSDPQVYERGNWRFLNNETQLEMRETGGTPNVLNISELTAARMVATFSENFGGVNYTYTATYTAR